MTLQETIILVMKAIQNYIIATQNFGNEIQDSIDSIFEKPSSRYSNNIAARNTILRHQSDLLLDKKEDSLKYRRVPQGLLLSDKKKFSATNPVLFKQLNLSTEKLDEDIKKVLENKDNETVARQLKKLKEFYIGQYQRDQQHQHQQQHSLPKPPSYFYFSSNSSNQCI